MKIKLYANQRIKSEDGTKEFVVDSLIHEGSGQGDIYKVHNGKDVYALKLFHTGDIKKLKRQIENLKRRGGAGSAFVHPLYTVKVGESIGYIMEYVGGDHYTDGYILFNGEDTVGADGKIVRMEIPFNEKIAILYNIAEAAKILYEADIALTDFKFDNIKINKRDFSVKILDTDTAIGGRTKPIVAGTVGFMPPLTMRGEETPDKYNDSYALAVMIFMTLIGGHPLVGGLYNEPCNTSIDTYTFATNPVYIYNSKDSSNRPLPSQKRVIERMKKYPRYFLDGMHKTFVDGLFDKTKRVEPREWGEILVRLYQDHYICKHCGEEHFFGGKSKNCNVCGMPLQPPIKLICEESDKSGVHLFNGSEIYTNDLWSDSSDYKLFEVVVSDYDKKYGLMLSAPSAVLKLKNGLAKDFTRGEVIPIFMDSVIEVGKYKLKFIGGQIL